MSMRSAEISSGWASIGEIFTTPQITLSVCIAFAEELILTGLSAYVDEQTAEEIAQQRGLLRHQGGSLAPIVIVQPT